MLIPFLLTRDVLIAGPVELWSLLLRLLSGSGLTLLELMSAGLLYIL